ncbi:MAG: HD domain-containing protein [Amphritea sp.]|nr:HD domain-containing protein [Amphritea sp.]
MSDMSDSRVAKITGFFLELDALKHVQRRSYVTGGDRLENSAEHSWQLAMACWSINRYFQLGLNEERLIKLALVHDLGEIDAGDTFLYSSQRSSADVAERQCVKRLAADPGNGIDDLEVIWEEQETGSSPETKLLKVADRLLPFLLNVNCQGKTWRELEVRRSQVLNAHAFIEQAFPEIHSWMLIQIDHATEQGWLINDSEE